MSNAKLVMKILNRPRRKRKGLADNIKKIIKGCPTCGKKKTPPEEA